MSCQELQDHLIKSDWTRTYLSILAEGHQLSASFKFADLPIHLQLNQLRVQPQTASKPKVAARVEFVRTNFAAKRKAPKGCDCKSCCNCRKGKMMEKMAAPGLDGLVWRNYLFVARLRITSSKICFHCSSWFCKLQKLLGVWFVYTIYNMAWKLFNGSWCQ